MKTPNIGESAIVLRAVQKRFGATIAVNDVSLEIPTNSVFGLIGPNGAGKTTTFSMLAGYLSPNQGEIRILGSSPHRIEALRGMVGILPQDALLPPDERVGDFLIFLGKLQGMNAKTAEAAARSVLAEVQGSDWWSQRCGTLSHGMAKRVALAQALLGDPQILLLDEPTAGLDPRIAHVVRQVIITRKGRATLIISSHNLQELEEICDHAAILDRGRLMAHGFMEELTASTSEVRFEIADGPVPADVVRTIEGVRTVTFDPSCRELTIRFERNMLDAEEMIRRATMVLYQHNARISAVNKGKRLETRVLELTH